MSGRSNRGARSESNDENAFGHDPPKQSSPWEWVAAGISLVIVLSAVGFLAFQGFTATGQPPAIQLEVDSIHPSPNGYLVEFTAHNRGSRTVAGLHVSGELSEASAIVERSQTVIDFVPGGAARQAGLFFSRDPGTLELRLRAEGFDLP